MCVTATATTVALTSARASGEFSPEARLLLLLLLLLGAWATLSSCSVTAESVRVAVSSFVVGHPATGGVDRSGIRRIRAMSGF